MSGNNALIGIVIHHDTWLTLEFSGLVDQIAGKGEFLLNDNADFGLGETFSTGNPPPKTNMAAATHGFEKGNSLKNHGSFLVSMLDFWGESTSSKFPLSWRSFWLATFILKKGALRRWMYYVQK